MSLSGLHGRQRQPLKRFDCVGFVACWFLEIKGLLVPPGLELTWPLLLWLCSDLLEHIGKLPVEYQCCYSLAHN